MSSVKKADVFYRKRKVGTLVREWERSKSRQGRPVGGGGTGRNRGEGGGGNTGGGGGKGLGSSPS